VDLYLPSRGLARGSKAARAAYCEAASKSTIPLLAKKHRDGRTSRRKLLDSQKVKVATEGMKS